MKQIGKNFLASLWRSSRYQQFHFIATSYAQILVDDKSTYEQFKTQFESFPKNYNVRKKWRDAFGVDLLVEMTSVIEERHKLKGEAVSHVRWAINSAAVFFSYVTIKALRAVIAADYYKLFLEAAARFGYF